MASFPYFRAVVLMVACAGLELPSANRDYNRENAAAGSPTTQYSVEPEQLQPSAADIDLTELMPWTGPAINQYIDGLGQKLVRANGITPGVRFSVRYFSQPRSQAGPGANVFVSTGLITAARGENDLTSAMALELARLTGSRKPRRSWLDKFMLLAGVPSLPLSGSTGMVPGYTSGWPVRSEGRRPADCPENKVVRLAQQYLRNAGFEAPAGVGCRLPIGEETNRPAGCCTLSASGDRMVALAIHNRQSSDRDNETPELRNARDEIMRYNELYARALGESLPGEPPSPPKLMRRPEEPKSPGL